MLIVQISRTCFFINMPNKKRCGAVIIRNGRVLLVHQMESKLWGIPKGKIEAGEDNLQTIIREVKEEIGYELNKNHVAESLKKSGNKRFPIIYLNKEINVIIDGREINSFRWVEVSKLSEFIEKHKVNGCSKKALNRVINGNTQFSKKKHREYVNLSDESINKIVDRLIKKLNERGEIDKILMIKKDEDVDK